MRQSPRERDGARQTEEARGDRFTMWERSREAAAKQEEGLARHGTCQHFERGRLSFRDHEKSMLLEPGL